MDGPIPSRQKAGLQGRLQERNLVFFVFNPPKASSCGFLLLWGSEHRLKGGLKKGLNGGPKGGLQGGLKGGLEAGLQGMNLIFFVFNHP